MHNYKHTHTHTYLRGPGAAVVGVPGGVASTACCPTPLDTNADASDAAAGGCIGLNRGALEEAHRLGGPSTLWCTPGAQSRMLSSSPPMEPHSGMPPCGSGNACVCVCVRVCVCV